MVGMASLKEPQVTQDEEFDNDLRVVDDGFDGENCHNSNSGEQRDDEV